MKKICNCFYVHKTNMSELPLDNFKDNDLMCWGVYYMHLHGLRWDVCKYDKENHTFSFISCPTFDVRYEPIVGDSFVFKKRNISPKWISGAKTVYHQKHLFINENKYDGFDVTESRARTELLEHISWYRENKSRIGSLKLWTEFLEIYCLETYMP